MKDAVTIGDAARLSGMRARTIRFYEAEGIVPAPSRTDAGYRLYTANDVRRLQLARRARLLGLALPEVAALVTRAFSSDCGAYAEQLLDVVDRRRAELDRRIAELQALRGELDALEEQVRRAKDAGAAGTMVATCGRCPLIDDRTGEPASCRCDPPASTNNVSEQESTTSRKERAMPQPHIAGDDVLEVLACDIAARPAGAPSPADLIPFARSAQRRAGRLDIAFDPAAAEAVAAFAEAERRCCTGIGWEVEHGDLIRLRITATPDQLDVLEQAWPWTGEA